MDKDQIHIKGARVNNLKNIEVKIPRNKIVVITGLSGSGKSSLAFDTMYAEGQRRYVESLSSYARQFLGRMSRPEVDFIRGIPPAIAIQQKVNTSNTRSTVGTSTEIYEYIRLLFARIGKTFSPISSNLVQKHEVEDLIACMQSYPEQTKYALFSPVELNAERSIESSLKALQQQGFNRIEVDGKLFRIEEALLFPELLADKEVLLLIDRLSSGKDKESISRLFDSAETAYYQGKGECRLHFYLSDEQVEKHVFSRRFELDGLSFEEPTDLMFNFNSPLGACPTCKGFGDVIGIDEDLVIPNQTLSVYEDCVVCWKGEKMSEFKRELILNADKVIFPIHKPYYQLSGEQKSLLWKGCSYFSGIDGFFKFLEENQYKIQYRVMYSRFRGKTICPDCKGSRLKPEAQYVKVGGKSVTELVLMPISELQDFFLTLELDSHDAAVAKRLMTEIHNRIRFLMDVGLGYLTLNRLSSSLSGGESQRINLATSLGSTLVGSLYILDEPSIGLHPKDTALLIHVLHELKDLGNTVVVVEHDEEIIRAADYIIDIGPQAGRLGGNIVYEGDMSNLTPGTESHTVRYLLGEEKIEIPLVRRKWNNYIKVCGALQNNLKNLEVKFPLGIMTVVTGVSGSGKSSLVRDILYNGLKRRLSGTLEKTGRMGCFEGDLSLVTNVEFVNQNPIGKSSRSNPVTYLKAFDDIRSLFAAQPLAKQMGFTAAHFSFNVDGGRCEECKGEGTVTVEMQFMADITLECDSCHGKRFKSDVLDVQYDGKNISDVLDMTVNQAIEFFDSKGPMEKKITKNILPLQEVGLGYIKLGQSSSTLSGGESQRVKLAWFLSQESDDKEILIFDEPTTGLHFHDINTLLKAFNRLIGKGHTIIIIEHNLEVIKCADYIIDLGPEGGVDGGHLVCAGTPEEVAQCKESYTGQWLAKVLDSNK